MSSEEAWSIISSLSDFEDEQSVVEPDFDHPSTNVDHDDDARNILSIATLKIPILKSAELTPTEEKASYSAVTKTLTTPEHLDTNSLPSTLPPPPSRFSNGTVQRAINFYEQLANEFLSSFLKLKSSADDRKTIVGAKTLAQEKKSTHLSHFAATSINWIKANLGSLRSWIVMILLISCLFGLNVVSKFALSPKNLEPPVVRYWGPQTPEPRPYFSWNKSPVIYKKWYNSPADFHAAVSQIVAEVCNERYFQDLESKSKDYFKKITDFKIQEFSNIKLLSENIHELSREITVKASPVLKEAREGMKKLLKFAQSKTIDDLLKVTKAYSQISKNIVARSTSFWTETSKTLKNLWSIWKKDTYPSLRLKWNQIFECSMKISTKWLDKTLTYSNTHISQLKGRTMVWGALLSKHGENGANLASKEYHRVQPVITRRMQTLYGKFDSQIRLIINEAHSTSISFYNRYHPFLVSRLSELLDGASTASGDWMNIAKDKTSSFFLGVVYGATKVLDNLIGTSSSKLTDANEEAKDKKVSKYSRKIFEDKRSLRNQYQRKLEKTKARNRFLGKPLCKTGLMVV